MRSTQRQVAGLRSSRTPPRLSAVLAACALFLGAPLLAQQGGDVAELSTSLEALSERVQPGVVQIFATGYTPGQGVVPSTGALVARERGSGSGVIVDSTGYIVTNAHVIANASRVQVALPAAADVTRGRRSVLLPRGRIVGAHIVGRDRETDLAVLKVEVGRELHALELGDSEALKPGQLVMAFGSPLGLDNSVSLGVVSAVARQIRADDRMIYIQTDASINPGSSGGPLIDVSGRVVGISTFIITQSGGSEGIGFAAPSNIVRNVYEQIRQFGRVRRGEIGVRAQTITPELAEGLGLARDWGVVLADVYPRGAASKAGLRIGDIVLTLDDKVMENARQFQVNLYPRSVGDVVTLEVLRGDMRATYSVSSIDRPGDPERLQHMVRPEEHLISGLGILALNLTPEVATMLPGLRQSQGVVVAVSSAQAVPVRGEPLQPGDVIHALNQRPVGTVAGLRAALDQVATGEAVVLHVERSRELVYVTLIRE